MLSYKTIKLEDDTQIMFKFYIDHLIININTIDTSIELCKTHDEFSTILSELKNNFSISNHYIRLVKFWFNKNNKKYFPSVSYTTKYGRTINY